MKAASDKEGENLSFLSCQRSRGEETEHKPEREIVCMCKKEKEKERERERERDKGKHVPTFPLHVGEVAMEYTREVNQVGAFS